MVFQHFGQMPETVVDGEEASLRQDRDASNKVQVRGEKDVGGLLQTLGEIMKHKAVIEAAMKAGHGITFQAQGHALEMLRSGEELATMVADLTEKCRVAANTGDHDDSEGNMEKSGHDSPDDEFDDDE